MLGPTCISLPTISGNLLAPGLPPLVAGWVFPFLGGALLALTLSRFFTRSLVRLQKKENRAPDRVSEKVPNRPDEEREELLRINSILIAQQEAAREGILVLDDSLRILRHNRRFAEILKPEGSNLTGDLEAFYRLLRERAIVDEEWFRRFRDISEGKEESCGCELTLQDGEVIEIYTSPALAPDDRLFGRVWFFKNITPRRKMEEELRLSEEKYRQLVELSPEGIAIHREEKLSFLNPAGARMLGYDDPAPLYGKEILEFVSPEYRNLVSDRIRKPGEQIPSSRLLEEQFIRKDGSTIHVEVLSTPYPDPGEKARIVIFRDISHRAEAEKALKRSEALHRTVVESLSEGVILQREEGIVSINGNGARILRLSEEEILSNQIHRIFRILPDSEEKKGAENSAESEEDPFRSPLRTGRPVLNRTVGLQRGEEEILWLHINSIPIPLPDSESGTPACVTSFFDITELKQTTRRLKKQTLFHQRLLDSIPSPIFYKDATGRLQDCNSTFEEMFRIRREKIAGSSIDEFLDPEAARICRELDQKVLESKQEVVGEFAYSRDRDTPLHFLVFLSPFVDTEGRLEGIVGALLNITERKEMEEKIRKITEAVQQTTESVVITDRGGKIEFVNQGFEALTGFSEEEALGQNPRILKSNRHTHDFYREMWEIILSGSSFRNVFINKKKNGEFYYEEKIISPIKDPNGEVISFVSTGRDITEKIKIEQALTESENKFRDLFEKHSAVMLLVACDEDLRIVDANISAGRFYGYSREALREKCYMDLLPGSISSREREGMRRGVHDSYFISRHRMEDGTERDVEIHASSLSSGGFPIHFCILHDITDRVRIENELKKTTEELALLNQQLENRVKKEMEKQREQEQLLIHQSRLAEMGEMIGAIAHQWRQPLNALGLIIQDIEDAYEYRELDETYIHEMVERSMLQIHFMSRTIDDFRNFFKPQKKKDTFFPLQDIREVLTLLFAQLNNNNIRIVITLPDENEQGNVRTFEIGSLRDLTDEKMTLSLSVQGYANEFKQVVINLINNARDAILDKKSELPEREGAERSDFFQGEIGIFIEKMKKEIIIRIQDNGAGIPEEIIERIFDPYFSTREEGKGTGIGLYMSKVIIEKNFGGTLSAGNREEGALFTIRLPLKEL